jgi:NADH:ubiquinone oxidoreductase subunit E
MMDMAYPEHPDVTEEMWREIDGVIEKYSGQAGSVIAALRESQNAVGWLPAPVMEYLSEGLNLPRADVFGVASFYSLFSLEPRGRHIIKVCTGTACYVKGIKEVISRISNKYDMAEGCTTEDRCFSLESVRCLGACGLAPVVVVGDDVHGAVQADTVLGILERYE